MKFFHVNFLFKGMEVVQEPTVYVCKAISGTSDAYTLILSCQSARLTCKRHINVPLFASEEAYAIIERDLVACVCGVSCGFELGAIHPCI